MYLYNLTLNRASGIQVNCKASDCPSVNWCRTFSAHHRSRQLKVSGDGQLFLLIERSLGVVHCLKISIILMESRSARVITIWVLEMQFHR